jgi:hypothetical protein
MGIITGLSPYMMARGNNIDRTLCSADSGWQGGKQAGFEFFQSCTPPPLNFSAFAKVLKRSHR